MGESVKFTKTGVKVLPAGKGRVDYHDTESPLSINVTPAGTRTYYLIKRIGSKVERIRIGRVDEMHLPDARAKATELLNEIAKGANPGEAKRVVKGEPTLADLFEQFLEGRRSKTGRALADKTVESYRDSWRLHCQKIADKKPTQVSADDIERLYRTVGAKYPTTANRLRAMLSSMFSWAKASKLVSVNPVADVPKAFEDVERKRFLNTAEVSAFLASLDVEPKLWRVFFTLSLMTGVRRSNIEAAAWDQFDLDAAAWWLPTTKNGDPQLVALAPMVVDMLRDWRASGECHGSDWVFPSRSASGHVEEPKTAMRRILARAGIEDCRIHDLRHTIASWMVSRAGVSLTVVGKALNQKTQKAAARYAHVDVDPVRAALASASEAMLLAKKGAGDE
ncbi:tyrosine-type recombinase/integrase [Crenobacter caeni]|uniref:Tyrosine-type recombinase/integrase n=1 Tax=Crenobacter caeni TaxID=2705474 RepID=A0A6B2KUI8_9NEIS|nr:site-specific integrase [Crenobacter caeni]NDV13764.1 tyrosine-type recombinase/integrase [Crenobacter caeni]